MMICPETYYDKYLKGKNAEQILSVIRSLKREISHLKKVIEHPEYKCMTCPGEEVRISCNRDYLAIAKKALIDVGGVYLPTKSELKSEEFNANIPYISKVEFCIGGYFGGYETKTVTIEGDSICMDFEHSLVIDRSSSDNFNVKEIDKESFLEGLTDLYIGEWSKNYDPSRFGYRVLDGTQWHLYIYFSNGRKALKIHGSNDYPYNFNRLLELFDIDPTEEDEELL